MSTYIRDTITDVRIGMAQKYSIEPETVNAIFESIFEIEEKFKYNMDNTIGTLEAYFDALMKYNKARDSKVDKAELEKLWETFNRASIELEQLAEA
jgi:hypothetical protein